MTRDELIAAMQLTAAAAAKPRAVKVPGWGQIHVRDVTVAEADEQAEEDDDAGDGKDKCKLARGAARVICNEDGSLVFNPDLEEDVELIAQQPWALLKQVTDAAAVFNATSAEGSDAAKNG